MVPTNVVPTKSPPKTFKDEVTQRGLLWYAVVPLPVIGADLLAVFCSFSCPFLILLLTKRTCLGFWGSTMDYHGLPHFYPIFITDLDQNLDAHGWFDRAKELMADDYYYQAQGAATCAEHGTGTENTNRAYDRCGYTHTCTLHEQMLKQGYCKCRRVGQQMKQDAECIQRLYQ